MNEEGQGRKVMESREESRQREVFFFFVGEVVLQEERGERCIVTDEMELWPKEGGRLDREKDERIMFSRALSPLCNLFVYLLWIMHSQLSFLFHQNYN